MRTCCSPGTVDDKHLIQTISAKHESGLPSTDMSGRLGSDRQDKGQADRLEDAVLK